MVQGRLALILLVVLVVVSLSPVCFGVESVATADSHRYQPAYQNCIPEGYGDLHELSSFGGDNWLAVAGHSKVVPLSRLDEIGEKHDVPGIAVASNRLTINPQSDALGWKSSKLINISSDKVEIIASENSTEARYTDYVYGKGRDLYILEDTPQGRIVDYATSTVHGIVEVRVYADILGQGRTLIKTDGNIVEGSWESYDGLIYSAYQVNPVTGQEWTWAEVDAMQAGIELKDAVCYDLYVRMQCNVGSQTFWPVTPVECTPGAAAAWTDVDLDTYIGGLPGGVTGCVLHIVNTDASTEFDFGLRKNGSTDARTGDYYIVSHSWATVGVDANKIFECYVQDKDKIDIYIVAYTTTGVTFNTNAVNKSLGSTGSWTDIDCSVEAPNADGLLWEINNIDASSQTYSLRNNGSTDNRINYSKEHFPFGAIIGCDASQICEGYIGSTNVDFYLIGYITDGATFLTNATDYSLAGTGAWADLSALPAGADMGFFEIATTATNLYGLRTNGSAENIYKYAAGKAFGIVAADTLLVEGEIGNVVVDFWLVGYTGSTITAPAITTNAATNVAATTARLNAYVDDDGGEDCEVRFEYDTDSGAPYTFNTAWVAGYSTGESPYVDIDSLNTGIQYFFRAQIKNSDSTVDGGELDFTTSAAIGEPENFLAVGKDSETVVLTWDKGDGATDTYIRRKLGGYPASTADGSLVYFGSLSSCLDENLASGTTYYYSAWGYSGGTYSAASDDDFVTLPLPGADTGDALPAPSQPSGWFQSPDTSKVEGIPGASLITDNLSDALDMPAGTLWMAFSILITVVVSVFAYMKINSLLLAFMIQAITVIVLSVMGIMPLWIAFVLLAMGGSLAYVMSRS